ncbi:hypothetical protein [Oceanibacterium hippocampi]|uniref:Tetratricopeptide repeat protein n=1 Tax=Oceanibacterium hippocampi TaxID=745714 RepID=A0A1Y5U3S6_9PROT|nr:hypothetical protein [Oceanibacterium hippocampi]SLN76146.1 hypothetical protein OCH7691_04051 [Oceanibacterium hippocampi]
MDRNDSPQGPEANPPTGLPAVGRALWHLRAGNWRKAHEIVQDDPGPAAAWIHAHLHRQEGDEANAAYWYRRAGQPVCREPLEAEWRALAGELAPSLLKP